jgi:ATP-dependent Clp protease ATP-binding subunit ClpC
MFERFAAELRDALRFAEKEARELGHDFVSPGHILLGLSRAGGLAAGILSSASPDSIVRARAELSASIPPSAEVRRTQLPLTRPAKRVLELALVEALALGQRTINAEHALLALTREPSDEAGRILREIGIERDALHRSVLAHTPGPKRRRRLRVRSE